MFREKNGQFASWSTPDRGGGRATQVLSLISCEDGEHVDRHKYIDSTQTCHFCCGYNLGVGDVAKPTFRSLGYGIY